MSKRIRVCEFNSCRHKSQGGGDHGVAGYIVKKNKPVKCAEEGESAVFREDIEQIVFIELENGVNGCYGMENDLMSNFTTIYGYHQITALTGFTKHLSIKKDP